MFVAEFAKLAYVDAQPAPDVEDARAFQRCIAPDEIKPAVLSEPPHEAGIAEGYFRPVGRAYHT